MFSSSIASKYLCYQSRHKLLFSLINNRNSVKGFQMNGLGITTLKRHWIEDINTFPLLSIFWGVCGVYIHMWKCLVHMSVEAHDHIFEDTCILQYHQPQIPSPRYHPSLISYLGLPCRTSWVSRASYWVPLCNTGFKTTCKTYLVCQYFVWFIFSHEILGLSQTFILAGLDRYWLSNLPNHIHSRISYGNSFSSHLKEAFPCSLFGYNIHDFL